MAIDPTTGFGTITAGTAGTPVPVLANVAGLVEGILNLDPTNWLFVRTAAAGLVPAGPYVLAGPGGIATISAGASIRLAVGALEGYACTPNNAGTATLTAAIATFKNS